MGWYGGGWGLPTPVIIQAGQASLPSLTPINDSNTGMWAPSADTLALSTDGVERARITSLGGTIFTGSISTAAVSISGAVAVWASGTQQIVANDTGGRNAGFGVTAAAQNYGAGIWYGGNQQCHIFDKGLSLGSYTNQDPPSNGLIVSGQVGVGTSSPGSTAAFEVSSTTKGLLLPRMTAAQRDLIASTAGLLIYNTTSAAVQFNNGSNWIDL